MLQNYQETLEDLDKTHVLELNNAFVLTSHGQVKKKLNNFQGAL
jgi:hypothetical protein